MAVGKRVLKLGLQIDVSVDKASTSLKIRLTAIGVKVNRDEQLCAYWVSSHIPMRIRLNISWMRIDDEHIFANIVLMVIHL